MTDRLDLDPGLHPGAWSDDERRGYLAGWHDGYQDRPVVNHPDAGTIASRALLAGFVLGFLLCALLASRALAAPRAAAVIPSDAPNAGTVRNVETDQRQPGAPLPERLDTREGNQLAAIPVAPVASDSGLGASSGPWPVTGIASFVSPRFGPRYLALPGGPGIRVRICGRVGCVNRTSTDAGPSLAMQRAGRVADLSHSEFARVCGCSPNRVGLIHVTVWYLDFDPRKHVPPGEVPTPIGGPVPTPPATDR